MVYLNYAYVASKRPRRSNRNQSFDTDMVTTCGFEEAENGNPRQFNHLARYHALQKEHMKVKQRRPSAIIAAFKSLSLTRADFDSLQSKRPISIGILSFAYAYLQTLVDYRPCKARVVMVDPFICNEIIIGLQRDYVLELVKARFSFLPIECPDGDWSLLILCPAHKKAFYYNPHMKCQKGFFLASNVLQRVYETCKYEIELVELHAPQQPSRNDSGVLVCEISALLMRRLVQAKPTHRLSLGLGGTLFVVGAGRTLLSTLILGLTTHTNATPKAKVELASKAEIIPVSSARQISPHQQAAAHRIAEEAAHDVWRDARKHTVQERSKLAPTKISTHAPRGWWSKMRRSESEQVKPDTEVHFSRRVSSQPRTPSNVNKKDPSSKSELKIQKLRDNPHRQPILPSESGAPHESHLMPGHVAAEHNRDASNGQGATSVDAPRYWKRVSSLKMTSNSLTPVLQD